MAGRLAHRFSAVRYAGQPQRVVVIHVAVADLRAPREQLVVQFGGAHLVLVVEALRAATLQDDLDGRCGVSGLRRGGMLSLTPPATVCSATGAAALSRVRAG
jgi:hypothetical protein